MHTLVRSTGLRLPASAALTALCILPCCHPAFAQTSVLTQHNDNFRSGQNLTETILKPANVNANSFGLLFSQPVDGQLYAQPLIVPGVTIDGAVHNVLYVATQHDGVYAFDARSNSGGNANPLWYRSFINPAAGITSVPVSAIGGCGNIYPEIGITATPVIDAASSTMYVVAKTLEKGVCYQRLHALDIRTGADRKGSPVVITAAVAGNGDGGKEDTFNPLWQLNRPGLLYTGGALYVAFGSHCDFAPPYPQQYHGWLMAYNPSTLKLEGAFNTTPNGGLGAIWMAGCGVAADSSNYLYFVTGNGSFDASDGPFADFGDSVLKVERLVTGLHEVDYFTPYDQQALADGDVDLGSGGLCLLPDSTGAPTHPHLLVCCGKEGKIYLVDRDKPGKYHPNQDSQIVQGISGGTTGSWSSPAYFAGSIYVCGVGDFLKQYRVHRAALSTSPVSTSEAAFAYPGATPSISANGASNGIVWIIENGANNIAVLHAFAANNVANELYNSTQNPADALGSYINFTVPTIANGKVYVGTAAAVSVFGPTSNGG